MSEYFEKVLTYGAAPKLACNWIIGDLTRVTNESGKSLKEIDLSPEHLAALTKIIDSVKSAARLQKLFLRKCLLQQGLLRKLLKKKA